jgi:hypothetical protein
LIRARPGRGNESAVRRALAQSARGGFAGAILFDRTIKHMSFRFTPSPARHSRRLEGATFEVRRLWRKDDGRDTDISHLVDRTYAYRSLRELRWHLAERFGLAPAALELSKA